MLEVWIIQSVGVYIVCLVEVCDLQHTGLNLCSGACNLWMSLTFVWSRSVTSIIQGLNLFQKPWFSAPGNWPVLVLPVFLELEWFLPGTSGLDMCFSSQIHASSTSAEASIGLSIKLSLCVSFSAVGGQLPSMQTAPQQGNVPTGHYQNYCSFFVCVITYYWCRFFFIGVLITGRPRGLDMDPIINLRISKISPYFWSCLCCTNLFFP